MLFATATRIQSNSSSAMFRFFLSRERILLIASLFVFYHVHFLPQLHTWNLANGNGGVGIYVNAPQTRLESVYLDWNNLHVYNPQLVTIIDSFFLCGGRIVLEASPAGTAEGVYAAGNTFYGEQRCGVFNIKNVCNAW